MKKIILASIITLMCVMPFMAHAAVQQPMPPWERFQQNYHFTSAEADLGRATTFEGFVLTDVFTANIRNDANVALRPPGYGTFSGEIPTEPFTWLFPQPRTLDYWYNFGVIQLPMLPLQTDGFLPPTSLW